MAESWGEAVVRIVKGPPCKNVKKNGERCGGTSYEVLANMSRGIVRGECKECLAEDYIYPLKA